jgi:hypothetical protein
MPSEETPPATDGGQENFMNSKTIAMAAGVAAMALAIVAPGVIASPPVRVQVIDGVLRVSGTPFADRIALRLDPTDQSQLQVDVGDDGTADANVDIGAFAAIEVRAGGGDDLVRLDTANGPFTTIRPTVVRGQRGDDTLIGGSGNEELHGGSGDDAVDGNGGADSAFLGEGNDTFVWDPGDGSDVVEGGVGHDTHVFNGAVGGEIMAATADGHRVRFTRNLGNIVMDLNGIEALDVRALGGSDAVTIDDLTGTDLSSVTVNLAGALGGTAADGAADAVRIVGTSGDDTISATADRGAVQVDGLAASVRITHADADIDTLAIDLAGGNDHVSIDPLVDGLIQVSVQ